MPDITCEVKRPVGTLSTSNSGWKKELNLVSWNHGPVRADIREWSPDKKSMTKGVTLYKSEVTELKRYLDILDLSLIDDKPISKSIIKPLTVSSASDDLKNEEEQVNYEDVSSFQTIAVAEGI